MTTAAIAEGVITAPEGLPEFTIGWDILGWTKVYLQQPDGPRAGEPWEFTPEQARFVLWFYAVDSAGRFTYRYAMLRRMKGWGKDPVAAALCAAEFVGPCRFAGWNEGRPYAKPHPAAWIQVAAVSKDQTRNLMTLFPAMFSRRAIDNYKIDMGKELIYAHKGRCRIEAVTSSPRALEGGRATFVVKDEGHHWLAANEGLEMSAVIARNTAKSRDGSARVLAISNAHAPGEGSDAERDYEAYKLGSRDLLYDSREAPDVPDLNDQERLLEALTFARGDSHWLDLERLVAEIQDPRTTDNKARRYYLNQIAASDDRAFDADRWRELGESRGLPEDGSMITLGFDGSESRDHTALVATEVATGFQWVAGYWEPVEDANGNVHVNIGEVNTTVDGAFERWNVLRFYADPPYWKEQLAMWEGRYNQPGRLRVAAFWTTSYKRMARALLNYRQAMTAGDVHHDGDPRFEAAVANAYRHEQQFVDDNGDRMWTIEKERPDSPLKIDAAMAGCLSWEARLDAIAAGEDQEEETGIAFWFPSESKHE